MSQNRASNKYLFDQAPLCINCKYIHTESHDNMLTCKLNPINHSFYKYRAVLVLRFDRIIYDKLETKYQAKYICGSLGKYYEAKS